MNLHCLYIKPSNYSHKKYVGEQWKRQNLSYGSQIIFMNFEHCILLRQNLLIVA